MLKVDGSFVQIVPARVTHCQSMTITEALPFPGAPRNDWHVGMGQVGGAPLCAWPPLEQSFASPLCLMHHVSIFYVWCARFSSVTNKAGLCWALNLYPAPSFRGGIRVFRPSFPLISPHINSQYFKDCSPLLKRQSYHFLLQPSSGQIRWSL